jgi:hypothetical protein
VAPSALARCALGKRRDNAYAKYHYSKHARRFSQSVDRIFIRTYRIVTHVTERKRNVKQIGISCLCCLFRQHLTGSTYGLKWGDVTEDILKNCSECSAFRQATKNAFPWRSMTMKWTSRAGERIARDKRSRKRVESIFRNRQRRRMAISRLIQLPTSFADTDNTARNFVPSILRSRVSLFPAVHPLVRVV